jgi:hypothetical protein
LNFIEALKVKFKLKRTKERIIRIYFFAMLIFVTMSIHGTIYSSNRHFKEQWRNNVALDSSKTPFLQFVLRIPPDNGWVLYIYTDSTYLYKHISMFGDSKILEAGKFTLKKENLTLHPTKKDPNFKNRKYHLIEELSNKTTNTRNFGCDEFNDKTYCLYMK